MDALFIATSVFFVGVLVRNLLLWVWLFDSHGYRLDKILLSFKNPAIRSDYVFNVLNFGKFFIIILYIFSVFFPLITDYYAYFVFTIYFISFLLFLLTIRTDIKKIYSLSKYFSAILLLMIASNLLLYLFPLFDRFFWLLIVEKLSAFLLFLYLIMLNLISDFYQDTQINNAAKKIAKHSHLTSIIITGTYNKTITKEYMARILSLKKNVLITQRSHTSLIDISRLILDSVNRSTDFLIAEIPVYKRGQISEIAVLLQPKVGVFTGVDPESILFIGKEKNIIDADKELINAVSKDGTLFFNGDNKFTLNLSLLTKKNKYIYGLDNIKSNTPNILRAGNIRFGYFSTTFSIFLNKKLYGRYTVRLIGRSVIESLLPGIGIALFQGFKKSEIRRALEKLSPAPCTLEPYLSAKKVIFINNSASRSLFSATSAIRVMDQYKKRKIIVFTPLTEVGHMSSKVHRKIAISIGITFDIAYVTNRNYFVSIKKGIEDSGGNCKLLYAPNEKIVQYINRELKEKDAVLFEGYEAQEVFDLLDAQPIY